MLQAAIMGIEQLRRTGLGAAVLLCTLVLPHAALADRDGNQGAVAGRADRRADVAALAVPRFSSTAWIGAGKNPFRMVAADLNGDRKADLAVVDSSSATVSVRFGDGTGQFGPRAAYRTGRNPFGLVASDLNGDGKLDLASAGKSRSESITVLINRGAGRFRRTGAYAAGREAFGVTAGDVNGDGLVDLLSAQQTAEHLTVLLGQGGGAFRVAHRYRGGRANDVVAADLNSDGRLDVVLADITHGAVTVRLGGGDGTFGPAAVYRSGSTPVGVTVADLNHDGKLDITAASVGGGAVSLLLGDGDGSFGPRVRHPMGYEFEEYVDTVLVADYDRDGHLDIATPGPYLRRGRGDGTMGNRERSFVGFPYTTAGAVADFNGDGWPDLAFSEACNEYDVHVNCERQPARAIAVMLNWTGQLVPPCVVPGLVGATQRQAGRALARAGCRIGHVRRRFSRTGRKGTVVGQRPKVSSVRRNNSPVNLVVGRGRRQ